jgi:protein-disulfide isomerase
MWRTGFGVVLTVAVLSGCGGSSAPATAPQAEKQAWAEEEILLQLKEMREDISRLQQDAAVVKSLDARLTALESAATRRADGAGRRDAPGREVLFGDAIPRGSASAQVAIVEFTDFECPYCARHFRDVFPQIKKTFIDTGRVRYYTRNYPLDFHSSAKPAAIAAFCAGKGGKYWQMHDKLFAGGGRALNPDFYREAAHELGIDAATFSACLTGLTSSQQVDADVQYATSVGVSGTPKFYIGRIEGNRIVDAVELSGARSFEVFSSAIDSRLSKPRTGG